MEGGEWGLRVERVDAKVEMEGGRETRGTREERVGGGAFLRWGREGR